MARILCPANIWRALGGAGLPPARGRTTSVPGAVLGSWSLNSLPSELGELVIALNHRTHLTLVFRLQPIEGFRARFGHALECALESLGISQQSIVLELAALDTASLVRNSNRVVTRSLHYIRDFCEIELSYHDDLHTIMMNLNDLPHPNRAPDYVPGIAVRSLFTEASSNSASPRTSRAG